MNVEDIRITVSVSVMFNEFSINMANTHGRTIYYKVSEKTARDGWVNVTSKAADYIVNDFKKTVEHVKLLAIIKDATKEHGY